MNFEARNGNVSGRSKKHRDRSKEIGIPFEGDYKFIMPVHDKSVCGWLRQFRTGPGHLSLFYFIKASSGIYYAHR